jgi:hypothetical protein
LGIFLLLELIMKKLGHNKKNNAKGLFDGVV